MTISGDASSVNPTMLVGMAIYVLDFPIHFVWKYIGLFPGWDATWYQTQLIITGGMLWFTVGLILQSFASGLRRVGLKGGGATPGAA
jgi:hypothetical protein